MTGIVPRLAERANQTADTWSGGEQAMRSIARGLIGDWARCFT
ncbi:MAG: hypothetical protein QF926_10365 [Alphaproteobacteria bacterium]|jgi:ABC-type branched-subunit amino acid transport system ATPase component|nr:hypothetical protein [Alphaproteobacteria bacterium]